MREPHLSIEELRAHWHLDLVLAYVRGRLPGLAEDDPERLLLAAREHSLNLDPFKRSRILPRVREVLAMIKSLAPASLLDLGTGRGRLLWQLFETMPTLAIDTVDQDASHVERIEAIRAGGISRVRGIVASVEDVPLPDRAADGVTALEVLEHATNPDSVAREALRLARRFLIISVPSKPDENPEHLRLFDPPTLEALFYGCGARRVAVRQVPGHYIALVNARSEHHG
jgi:2-polyprenyl-3-methyl-5-hydroxy-6-metoxy-1,4-benzoquinol methylase